MVASTTVSKSYSVSLFDQEISNLFFSDTFSLAKHPRPREGNETHKVLYEDNVCEQYKTCWKKIITELHFLIENNLLQVAATGNQEEGDKKEEEKTDIEEDHNLEELIGTKRIASGAAPDIAERQKVVNVYTYLEKSLLCNLFMN